MENTTDNNLQNSAEMIKALKSENLSLREQIQDLESADSPGGQQAEYQESQTHFQTIFELSPRGNKVISSVLKIIQINPAMVALLGYESKEDIIGTRI